MSDAGEWIDATLQYEGSPHRAEADRERLGGGLAYYGASVGAVRGTIRDAGRRYRGLSHDEITALSSELWAVPVYERRLASIVLLQSNVGLLIGSDLTRIEGFIREGRMRELVDPTATDVVVPLLRRLEVRPRARAELVIGRWGRDPDPWLQRAAELVTAAMP